VVYLREQQHRRNERNTERRKQGLGSGRGRRAVGRIGVRSSRPAGFWAQARKEALSGLETFWCNEGRPLLLCLYAPPMGPKTEMRREARPCTVFVSEPPRLLVMECCATAANQADALAMLGCQPWLRARGRLRKPRPVGLRRPGAQARRASALQDPEEMRISGPDAHFAPSSVTTHCSGRVRITAGSPW